MCHKLRVLAVEDKETIIKNKMNSEKNRNVRKWLPIIQQYNFG